jgi:membrane associated rhomboid family serine protease
MIPISDTSPVRRFPMVNWALIAINIIGFVYELTLRPRALDGLFMTWGVTPWNILLALAHPLRATPAVGLTLITSQFLHAGWVHLIGNMLFLWVFGDNVEDALGHLPYLLFYLAGGVIAGLAQVFILGPARVPSIGASGAIASVLGAYVVLYPWSRIRILIPLILLFWTIEVPAVLVLGWWFIQQFFYGAATLSEAASGVAFWAHIGGFVAGMIGVLPFVGSVRRRRRITFAFDDFDSTRGSL